jgi:NAD(P)-dependent dehydrogenase (short-subunit alcohol dehydrogenase family)
MVDAQGMRNLQGHHILVTGGAQGIGEGIVEDALERGAKVTFFDINESQARVVLQRLEKRGFSTTEDVTFEVCDVTKFPQIEAAVARCTALLGPVTGLVNNAGRNSYADPVEMTEEQWDAFFDLDLKSSWLMAKAVLPMMRAAGKGSIVNIASIHAHMSFPRYFPYAAAKSGLLGLTRNLALDEGQYGIRVNTVSPGYTETPLLRDWLDSNPGSEEQALSVHAMGFLGTPKDIAVVVSFLLSDDTRFVSGADWRVDGALSARFAG